MDPIIIGVLANPALSIVTFGIGLILGHRFNLWRDQRQEFNDAAQVIRATMLKHRQRPTPRDIGPNVVEIDFLEQRLRFYKRRSFRKAIARYYETKKKCGSRNEIGEVFYADVQPIIDSINNVLQFTKPR